MHSIGFKVFLSYWVSVILVIVVANLLGPHALRRPELIREAAVTSLALNGRAMIADYEGGGCDRLNATFSQPDPRILLSRGDGVALCTHELDTDTQRLVHECTTTGKVISERMRSYQLVLLPLQAASGTSYVVMLHADYHSPLQIFGWIPGATTFLISGIMSVVLAVLLSRPLRKLRKAARELASGNLRARVTWNSWSSFGKPLSPRDEIQVLMTDFNEMAEHLQAMVEAQRLLLRDVSHELRSPLARLNLALELAREEGDADLMPRHLDRIEIEAQRLNDLIQQLLSLSALTAEHEAATTEKVDLQHVLNEVLADARYEAVGRGCTVSFHSSETHWVRGHEFLLRRAIENVVRNAVYYSSTGGLVSVELSNELYAGARHTVVAVSDNGPGIPPEELRRIFQPFYRVDGARQRSTGGFGIGLTIVERSIQLHGGKIVARNRPEGGLTITIYLPAEAAHL